MRRIALVLLCLASFPAGSPGQSLTQVGVIDVRGPKGQRFDYLTMDDEDHYLLSAPLGRLATAAKPNGSTYAVPFREVYVVNTNGKAVTVVNVATDQIVATLHFDSETGMPQYDSAAKRALAHFPVPTGADVVKYDSGLHRAYAACSSGFMSIVQEDDPAHFHKTIGRGCPSPRGVGHGSGR